MSDHDPDSAKFLIHPFFAEHYTTCGRCATEVEQMVEPMPPMEDYNRGYVWPLPALVEHHRKKLKRKLESIQSDLDSLESVNEQVQAEKKQASDCAFILLGKKRNILEFSQTFDSSVHKNVVRADLNGELEVPVGQEWCARIPRSTRWLLFWEHDDTSRAQCCDDFEQVSFVAETVASMHHERCDLCAAREDSPKEHDVLSKATLEQVLCEEQVIDQGVTFQLRKVEN